MTLYECKGVGIDIVEIKRFDVFKKNRRHRFLLKTFNKEELDYCFSFVDVGKHLAGMFAVKEATSKALGTGMFPFILLQVKHTKAGKPEVWKGKRKLSVSVSVSYAKGLAMAVAIS